MRPEPGPTSYRTTCHSMRGGLRRSQNNPGVDGRGLGSGNFWIRVELSRWDLRPERPNFALAGQPLRLRSRQARRLSPHESDKQKKRPELFSSGRLGSPPPELPNHEMDSSELVIQCKRHFGNRFFPASESALNRHDYSLTTEALTSTTNIRNLGLPVPGLACVGGGPDLGG